MLEIIEKTDPFLSAYEEFERTAADTDTPWLHQLRKAAITRFGELGLPGKRNEDWKYTSLEPLRKLQLKLSQSKPNVNAKVIEPYFLDDALQLVFVNGYFHSELSSIDHLPDGLVLSNLQTAIAEHEELVEPHLAKYADHDALALTALNTAFLRDGVFIHVRKNCVIEKPIHIVHVSTAPSEPVMSYPRHLIVAECSSQVTVIESYFGSEEQVYFNNSVVEIAADENAVVDHYKILRESNQAFHIANLQIKQQRDSNVNSHYVALSGSLIRNESRTVFAGENAECTFNGLYLGRGKQHIDSHTVIDHAVPHCNSYELYKGLLDDKAKGVFNGKIYVREDAQKTDAKQSNQCILLSDDATIDTKPQLEIFADDVKCTHGATVGQLDETALFYLRSRGIGLEQAKSLLMFAFANDIIGRIKVDSIRQQLEELLLTRQHLPRYQEHEENS